MFSLFSSINKLSQPRETIKKIDMVDFYEKIYKDNPECNIPFSSLRQGKIDKVYNNNDYTSYLIHWMPPNDTKMMQIKLKHIEEKKWTINMSYILS